MEFTLCGFILSPLGFLWLERLDAWFPDVRPPNSASEKADEDAQSDSKAEEPVLNMTNNIAKLVVCQTIGGAWNTVLFIVIMGMLRGLDHDTIIYQIQEVSDFKDVKLVNDDDFETTFVCLGLDLFLPRHSL